LHSSDELADRGGVSGAAQAEVSAGISGVSDERRTYLIFVQHRVPILRQRIRQLGRRGKIELTSRAALLDRWTGSWMRFVIDNEDSRSASGVLPGHGIIRLPSRLLRIPVWLWNDGSKPIWRRRHRQGWITRALR
jgi:hypothetical protein